VLEKTVPEIDTINLDIDTTKPEVNTNKFTQLPNILVMDSSPLFELSSFLDTIQPYATGYDKNDLEKLQDNLTYLIQTEPYLTERFAFIQQKLNQTSLPEHMKIYAVTHFIDGGLHCKDGFIHRLDITKAFFLLPMSIGEIVAQLHYRELCSFADEITAKYPISNGLQVHLHRYIFILANNLGFCVAQSPEDHFCEQIVTALGHQRHADIERELLNKIATIQTQYDGMFTLLNTLFKSIKNALTSFGYIGRVEETYKLGFMRDTETLLKTLFNLDQENSSHEFFEIDDDDLVKDIQWGVVKEYLVKQVLKEQWITGDQAYINPFSSCFEEKPQWGSLFVSTKEFAAMLTYFEDFLKQKSDQLFAFIIEWIQWIGTTGTIEQCDLVICFLTEILLYGTQSLFTYFKSEPSVHKFIEYVDGLPDEPKLTKFKYLYLRLLYQTATLDEKVSQFSNFITNFPEKIRLFNSDKKEQQIKWLLLTEEEIILHTFKLNHKYLNELINIELVTEHLCSLFEKHYDVLLIGNNLFDYLDMFSKSSQHTRLKNKLIELYLSNLFKLHWKLNVDDMYHHLYLNHPETLEFFRETTVMNDFYAFFNEYLTDLLNDYQQLNNLLKNNKYIINDSEHIMHRIIENYPEFYCFASKRIRMQESTYSILFRICNSDEQRMNKLWAIKLPELIDNEFFMYSLMEINEDQAFNYYPCASERIRKQQKAIDLVLGFVKRRSAYVSDIFLHRFSTELKPLFDNDSFMHEIIRHDYKQYCYASERVRALQGTLEVLLKEHNGFGYLYNFNLLPTSQQTLDRLIKCLKKPRKKDGVWLGDLWNKDIFTAMVKPEWLENKNFWKPLLYRSDVKCLHIEQLIPFLKTTTLLDDEKFVLPLILKKPVIYFYFFTLQQQLKYIDHISDILLKDGLKHFSLLPHEIKYNAAIMRKLEPELIQKLLVKLSILENRDMHLFLIKEMPPVYLYDADGREKFEKYYNCLKRNGHSKDPMIICALLAHCQIGYQYLTVKMRSNLEVIFSAINGLEKLTDLQKIWENIPHNLIEDDDKVVLLLQKNSLLISFIPKERCNYLRDNRNYHQAMLGILQAYKISDEASQNPEYNKRKAEDEVLNDSLGQPNKVRCTVFFQPASFDNVVSNFVDESKEDNQMDCSYK
jgi:hypothetical protein